MREVSGVATSRSKLANFDDMAWDTGTWIARLLGKVSASGAKDGELANFDGMAYDTGTWIARLLGKVGMSGANDGDPSSLLGSGILLNILSGHCTSSVSNAARFWDSEVANSEAVVVASDVASDATFLRAAAETSWGIGAGTRGAIAGTCCQDNDLGPSGSTTGEHGTPGGLNVLCT